MKHNSLIILMKGNKSNNLKHANNFKELYLREEYITTSLNYNELYLHSEETITIELDNDKTITLDKVDNISKSGYDIEFTNVFIDANSEMINNLSRYLMEPINSGIAMFIENEHIFKLSPRELLLINNKTDNLRVLMIHKDEYNKLMAYGNVEILKKLDKSILFIILGKSVSMNNDNVLYHSTEN